MADNGVIVMVGPSLNSRGGIASVICSYKSAGLFKKWPILYLNSHIEGSKRKKLLAAFVALRIFAVLLVLRRVKVLHIHVARDTSFWRKSIFILLAYTAKCSVFIHMHSGGFPAFYWNSCGEFKKRIVRFILNHADRIIVLSSQWFVLLKGITENKRITKIPNFMVESQRGDAQCEREKDSVLFLGRLSDEKGFFDLLEAAALVKQRIPSLKLRCGGEGDMDEAMERMRKLGIGGNIELLGWVGEEERQNLLDCTAAFILPSYVEGLPMAVIEAMSRRVPVVASNVGGIPDIIDDGKDGFLVRPGDVKGIAEALIRLLEDPALQVRVGQAGKCKVDKQFSAEQIVPNIEKLYREYGVVPNLQNDQGVLVESANEIINKGGRYDRTD